VTQRKYWDSIDRVRAFLQFASEEARRIQQANRRTYIGSGMTHPSFLATLEKIDSGARDRIEHIAPAFC
jgi:hypothetical protein